MSLKKFVPVKHPTVGIYLGPSPEVTGCIMSSRPERPQPQIKPVRSAIRETGEKKKESPKQPAIELGTELGQVTTFGPMRIKRDWRAMGPSSRFFRQGFGSFLKSGCRT